MDIIEDSYIKIGGEGAIAGSKKIDFHIGESEIMKTIYYLYDGNKMLMGDDSGSVDSDGYYSTLDELVYTK